MLPKLFLPKQVAWQSRKAQQQLVRLETTAAVDTISAGEGIDIILSGAGNDTIDLTETTAAVDNIYFSAAANNGRTLSLALPLDQYNLILDASDLTAATGAHGAVAVALVTGGATYDISATDTTAVSVIEITTTLDDDVTLSASSTGADLLQALSSDATAAGSITLDTAGEDIANCRIPEW